MIKRLLVIAALAPIAVRAQTPATAARAIPPTLPIDRVVAIVGDQPLLWSDVLTAINQRRTQGLQVPADSAGQATLARTVLGELVDEEILVQKAKELKLEVTDADITAGADRQIKQVRAQFSSDENYRNELKKAGLGSPFAPAPSLPPLRGEAADARRLALRSRARAGPGPARRPDRGAAGPRSRSRH